tara:strand:- start:236 stop:412 length:177 start_codon:yes stop_codon:yes gene_type:complete
MRCSSCKKTIRNSQKGWTWREELLCPACYMEKHQVIKVKINRTQRNYDLVYVKKDENY